MTAFYAKVHSTSLYRIHRTKRLPGFNRQFLNNAPASSNQYKPVEETESIPDFENSPSESEKLADADPERSQTSDRPTWTGLLKNIDEKPMPLPSIAPKPVLNIRHIRQNLGLHEHNCTIRRYDLKREYPRLIFEYSKQLVAYQMASRGVREERNKVMHEVAKLSNSSENNREVVLKKKKQATNPEQKLDLSSNDNVVDDLSDELGSRKKKEMLIAEARRLSEKIREAETHERFIQKYIERMAFKLPNLTSGRTPEDVAELVDTIDTHSETNIAQKSGVRVIMKPSAEKLVWPSHVQIGSELGILDFAAAANTSGWGWYYFVDEAVMLEQALVQYALNIGRQRGWKVVSPPSIVYSHIAAACGFSPRSTNGEQQTYTLQKPERDEDKPDLSLIGTSEISLAGMKAKQTLEEADLPLKMMAVSRCYRAEAGARGLDTKGLYRVHEFTKVELFAWTMPDERSTESFGSKHYSYSDALFDEIMEIQYEILQNLGLRCRVLEMPASDLGASASRKRDIEAFFPSRLEKNEGWGEVTSTSNCTDYQTRRLETRLRRTSPGMRLDWPHTVNGTAVAIPRIVAAILENYWDERKKVVNIPEVLQPWMDNRKYIGGRQ